MKITRKNYEVFFMDYLDRRLTPAVDAELKAFLRANPDLEKELKEFENIKVPAETTEFHFKEQLKKNIPTMSFINERNFEYFCIAKLEGDLDVAHQAVFDKYISKHPEKKKEFEIYLKTKLSVESILFQDKAMLKKPHIMFWNKYPLWYYISVAASVLIILSFTFMFVRDQMAKKGEVTSLIQNESQPDQPTITSEPGRTPVVAKIENRVLNESEDMKKSEIPGTMAPDDLINDSFEDVLQSSEAGNEIVKDGPVSIREDMEFLHRRELIGISNPVTGIHLSGVKGSLEKEREDDFLTLREAIGSKIRDGILREEQRPDKAINFTFLDLADASVRGINRITGSDMQLNRYYDEDGELTSFAFTSNVLSLYHEVKK
ncbi:MAG: hypothetical protein JSV24_05010 [Bacteroidales bacterium]|nr:MAG: hypothetical protein JSV24_05010 [Bacteroidales bacterium]